MGRLRQQVTAARVVVAVQVRRAPVHHLPAAPPLHPRPPPPQSCVHTRLRRALAAWCAACGVSDGGALTAAPLQRELEDAALATADLLDEVAALRSENARLRGAAAAAAADGAAPGGGQEQELAALEDRLLGEFAEEVADLQVRARGLRRLPARPRAQPSPPPPYARLRCTGEARG